MAFLLAPYCIQNQKGKAIYNKNKKIDVKLSDLFYTGQYIIYLLIKAGIW